MFQTFHNKKVLFITTKNLDYIRNTQEIRLLSEKASHIDIIGSQNGNYIKRVLYVYIKLLITKVHEYDAIFVGFAPQLIIPFWGHKLCKRPVTIDFFISMYDTLCMDRKIIKANSLLGKLLHYLDAYTLKKANTIICDTKAHGNYFVEEFNASIQQMSILYLEANSQIYHPHYPKQKSEFYQVLYFGSILPLQGVEVVLEAYTLLMNKKNLQLTLIGPVNTKKLTCKIPVSSNINYIPWLSQEDLAIKIANADLCLAGHFHPTIQKARRTIPGKAYIYEAMDKKLILGDNQANHEYFKESPKHIFVPMGDSKALAETILREYEKE